MTLRVGLEKLLILAYVLPQHSLSDVNEYLFLFCKGSLIAYLCCNLNYWIMNGF